MGRKEEETVTDPAKEKIEGYLTRRIEGIRALGPLEGSFQKSTFMLEASSFAEAGLITQDERFAWTERMLRETGSATG